MDYTKAYAQFLKKFLKPNKKLRVIFDCSDGTVGIVLKELFRESRSLNDESRMIEAILINEKPDGNFPAHGPNPIAEGALDNLAKIVKKNKADLGVAFDGDGDRVFFVDDQGQLVQPDPATYLMAKGFKGSVLGDLRIGYLARELLAADKRKFIDSRVGHFFIKKTMKEKNINFGAELSGHYYFSFEKGAVWDSGILGAIYLINQVSSLRSRNLLLSQWIGKLPRYYNSGELNFKVENKFDVMNKMENQYSGTAKKISKLDGLSMQFGSGKNSWWFNIRPSNTENLLRLNLEAKSKKIFDQRLQEIKDLLSKK